MEIRVQKNPWQRNSSHGLHEMLVVRCVLTPQATVNTEFWVMVVERTGLLASLNRNGAVCGQDARCG